MATEKILQTRILNKIDTLENWGKSTLKIKKGEICFATVAASAGTGLEEPVVMVKVGTDEEKTFSELPWSFYAKASDVLAACKSEAGLKAFVNGVITDAKLASSADLEELVGRVTTAEGAITTLNGDADTAGSVAKAIKDAIDVLDLENTYVAKEDGKRLMTDVEGTKLAGIADGATKVEASENGKIKIDGVDTTVYIHPDKHAISEVDGLQDALDGKQAAGNYAAEVHTHVAADVTDFATEVAKVKVTNAEAADKDGNGKVIADTYAEKATTLAGYGIGDAYTKEEVDAEIDGAINTFVGAYITSDGGAIDKLQEIANWIDSDKDGAADVIADIEANAEGIENLTGRMDAVEDAVEAIDNHSHENKTVLDGITAEKVSAWDAAEQNAKDYADDQIEALGLGDMSKEAAADYVKKADAVGYNDILTKTEAAGAYQAKGEYYTKAEADAAFADSTEVDGQIDAKIAALDLANTYQAKGDYATAEQGGKADTAIQSVTSVAGNGIKATTEGNAVTIDWDTDVVLVFDCGDAGVVIE